MDYQITNRLSLLIALIVFFIGCNNSKKKEEKIDNNMIEQKEIDSSLFRYVYYRYSSNRDVQTFDFPLKYISESKNDTFYHLKYIINKSSYVPSRVSDTIEYFINTKDTIRGKRIINSSISENISLAAHKLYVINGKKHDVYKLKNKPNNLADNGVEYIWTPKLGIIIEKSIHWLHFYKFEILFDNEDREDLKLLYEVIYNDIHNTFDTFKN